MSWQPISSAPKVNGTQILGYLRSNPMWAGEWPTKHVVLVYDNGEWFAETDYHGNCESFHPTHWMPLPEPPHD